MYNRTICSRRSTDGGVTWGPLTTLTPIGDHATQPMLVYSSTAKAVIAHFSLGPPKSGRGRVAQVVSFDDGQTWSPPDFIDRHLGPKCFSGMHGQNPLRPGPGRGAELASGRVVMNGYIANLTAEHVPNASTIYTCVWYSDNGGVTWNVSQSVVQQAAESQIAQLGDGRLYFNSRVTPRGSPCGDDRCRGVAWSTDDGLHFSPLHGDPNLPQPHTATGDGGCQGSVLGLGNRTYFSLPSNATTRSHMAIRLSLDYAASWVNETVVHNGGSAYSCLSNVPQGDAFIGLLYERDADGCRGPACQIVFSLCRADLSECAEEAP